MSIYHTHNWKENVTKLNWTNNIFQIKELKNTYQSQGKGLQWEQISKKKIAHTKDEYKAFSALLCMWCKLGVILPWNTQHNHDYAGEVKGKWVRERKMKTERGGRRWRERQRKADRNKIRMNNNEDVVAESGRRGKRGRISQGCVWSCPWLNNNQTCKNIYLPHTQTQCGLHTQTCSHQGLAIYKTYQYCDMRPDMV